MQPTIFYLIRHGESESNARFVVGGQTDAPLTERGLEQAEQARQALTGVKLDAVYSSDLQRAVRTAEVISGHYIPEDHRIAALGERDFGKLEGQPMEAWFAINQAFHEQYGDLPLEERWKHAYAPTIETNEALVSRFMGALRTIAGQHPGQTLLIGTHAGPVRMTLCKLGYASEAALGPGSFENGARVVLSYDGQCFRIVDVVGVNLNAARAE